MDQILLVSTQVGILAALIAVGFVCRRLNFFSREAIKGMVDFLVTIVTPAVIVDVFARPFDVSMLKGLGLAAILSVAIHLFAILIAEKTIRGRKENTCVVQRLSAIFSNSGFMGIPMERAILGDVGVFFGAVYMTVFNLFIWSYGIRVMKKESLAVKDRLRLMLVNPGTVGLTLGLLVFVIPADLPELIRIPVGALADCNTPLAMVVIGNYLAETKLGDALSGWQSKYVIFLRLIALPLFFILLAYPLVKVFEIDSMVILALTIAISAPTAAMVSMFAAKFDRDIATAVALVSSSTVLSIITMPFVISLAMMIF